jgi:Spx/MgsR family transcriptional regulator
VIELYGIANCDTVRRARAWLAQQGRVVRFHDFKREGVPADALARWLPAVGRERLLNRQGTTWRRLDDAQRARADSDAAARSLLAEHFSLIKRPVVEWPDRGVTVGFDPQEWAQRLGPSEAT